MPVPDTKDHRLGPMEIAPAARRVGGKLPAMRPIVKAFRRPPTGLLRDRNGGLPRLSATEFGSVAHALRCPASLQRTLLAENLGKPSLWVIIGDPWYHAAWSSRSTTSMISSSSMVPKASWTRTTSASPSARVATPGPRTIAPGRLAQEALGLMNAYKITSLFVTEGDAPARPLGILHLHDCLRAGVDGAAGGAHTKDRR